MLHLATKFPPSIDAFETAYRAGFRFAELWTDGQVLENWTKVVEMASGFPMQYAIHFPNRGDLSDAAIQGAIELYNALSCSAIVIHKPMFRRYAEQLLAIDPDIRLGVENHRLSEVKFEKWARKNEWLTLDVEHLWKYTLRDAPLGVLIERVDELLHQHGDKLAHVHLPGYVPGQEEHRPMYCSREMIFEVMDLLANNEYQQLVVAESDARFQNEAELQMDVLLFRRWRELRGTGSSKSSNQKSGDARTNVQAANEPTSSEQPLTI